MRDREQSIRGARIKVTQSDNRKEIGNTIMKIQINTDHTIHGREGMIRRTEAVVESTLDRLAEHITRVDVHLRDENGTKDGGHDKLCVMEARLKGRPSVAVTNQAETIDQAIGGAAGKLKRSLDHILGRLKDHKGRKNATFSDQRAVSDAPGMLLNE